MSLSHFSFFPFPDFPVFLAILGWPTIPKPIPYFIRAWQIIGAQAAPATPLPTPMFGIIYFDQFVLCLDLAIVKEWLRICSWSLDIVQTWSTLKVESWKSEGSQYWFQIFRNTTSPKQWYLQIGMLDVCGSFESTLLGWPCTSMKESINYLTSLMRFFLFCFVFCFVLFLFFICFGFFVVNTIDIDE